MVKAALCAAALAFPLVSVVGLSGACADRLARVIAGRLSVVLPVFHPVSADGPVNEALPGQGTFDEKLALTRVTAEGKRGHTLGRSRSAAGQHGVRISSAQVLALAARRAMPQAVPVKASAEHPAGLLLRGVSALGVGLQDSDVLTEAAGQKASSVAVVVGIVLAARGRQVPEISGRFFRAGVPFGLTVEQPYPKAADPG